MSEIPNFSPSFINKLRSEGFPIADIENNVQKGNPIKSVRSWTGYSDSIIREGFFQEDRDAILPVIQDAIYSDLQPWIQTKTNELPSVQLISVARRTGLSPESIGKILKKFPLEIQVNGSRLISTITVPEFPTEKIEGKKIEIPLTLADCDKYRLDPKKIQRRSRYLSRPPGGGPVQKAKVDERKINGIIRKQAFERVRITFEKSGDGATEINENLKIETNEDRQDSIQEMIYAEPNGQQIMEVLEWFRTNGGEKRKNWITGDEKILAEKLIQLAQGVPVDFLIWNCIGLEWRQNQTGEYPSTIVVDNMDSAITYYFKDRIAEMTEQLATIGNPQVIILVPSNEALADEFNIWNYVQSKEERKILLDATVKSLEKIANSIKIPEGNSPVQVWRWDAYLQSVGATTEDIYTVQGIETLQRLPDYDVRLQKAGEDARQFFGQFNIVVNDNLETCIRELNYLGVYVGEGVASRGNKIGNKDMIWVNFEENNIRDSEYIGANGNIAIVTPVTPQQISEYYQWKKGVIASRKEMS